MKLRPVDWSGKRGKLPTNSTVTNRRSLDECWAQYFGAMGWRAERRVPGHFVLRFHEPILARVCEGRSEADLRAYADLVGRGPWQHEILVVGDGPLTLGPRTASITDVPFGLLLDLDWSAEGSWGLAALMHCTHCGRPSLVHSIDSYRCRVSGCHDGGHHIGRSALTDRAHDIWRAIARQASGPTPASPLRQRASRADGSLPTYDLWSGRDER